MKNRLKINIGDRTKMILNGAPKELEVVNVISGDKKLDSEFSFFMSVQDLFGCGYLDKVDITLPDGRIIECRPLHSML